ncbi:MAG TPA: enoyl-CoA hydratase-related protein [Acidimicrobiales bacterium]|nr:enoyl-CoA hydratase-related protein [Acidimicrobiales bacterium]
MPTVLVERVRPGIDLVTLNRPDRLNAITHELVTDLLAAFDRIEADKTARVVVLTGAGRGFCAGLDLKEAHSIEATDGMGPVHAMMTSQKRWWTRFLPRMRSLPQPIIAAVNGPAAGGGFVLSLGADIRLAAESASFHGALIKMGVSGVEFGLGWVLPRMVGMSRAAEIVLTSRKVDAQEAVDIGLVSRVVPDGAVVDAALDLAEEICANTPFGVWMTKNLLWSSMESSLEAAIELETRTQILALLTEDQKEQRLSLAEKRPPRYLLR